MNIDGHPRRRSLSVAAVVMNPFGQRPNRFGGLGIGSDALGGAPAGVQDGGVVASSEGAADGGQALAGVLAGEVHGDLARPGDARGAAGGQQVLAADVEELARGGHDPVDGGGGAPPRPGGGAARGGS